MCASPAASTGPWTKRPNRAMPGTRSIPCACSTNSSPSSIRSSAASLLLDLEGLPREQVAEVLGLSVNAVAVRMTRLRQLFEQRFVED